MEVVVTEKELGNKWVNSHSLRWLVTLLVLMSFPPVSDISSAVMERFPWQPKRTSSLHLSAISPQRASPAKSETWCLWSTRSSPSPETSRTQAQTQEFTSPFMESTVTQGGVPCRRGLGTFMNEDGQTALFWRCWTSGSCWGSKWSTTTPAPTVAGISSVLKWPTQPTRWQQSFSVESGWTRVRPMGRCSECSTPSIRSRAHETLDDGWASSEKWLIDFLSLCQLYSGCPSRGLLLPSFLVPRENKLAQTWKFPEADDSTTVIWSCVTMFSGLRVQCR